MTTVRVRKRKHVPAQQQQPYRGLPGLEGVPRPEQMSIRQTMRWMSTYEANVHRPLAELRAAMTQLAESMNARNRDRWQRARFVYKKLVYDPEMGPLEEEFPEGQVPPAKNRGLVEQLHVFGAQLLRIGCQLCFIEFIVGVAGTNNLVYGDALQRTCKILEQAGVVWKLLIDIRNSIEQSGRVACRE